MSGTDSAGTLQCCPAAHATARTIGAHTARPEIVSSTRRATGDWRSVIAARSSSAAMAKMPAAMRAAPPTWALPIPVTNPMATTGGAAER